MIHRVERTLSEKNTSIDQNIEVTQKGIIALAASSGRVIGIPTNIPNVKGLTLTAMNAVSASVLGLTGGWYSDLVLYKASTVQVCFANVASAVPLAQVGYRTRMSNDFKLYTAIASMTATQAASNSLLASKSLFKQELQFGTNQTNFLKVTVINAASVPLARAVTKFAYEVKGYTE